MRIRKESLPRLNIRIENGKKQTKKQKEQEGLASLYTTLIVVFVIVILIVGYTWGKLLGNGNLEDSNFTKTELIERAVEDIKQTYVLPAKLDNVTTLVDITPEPGAIRYYYVLSDMDTKALSNTSLKEYLKPTICSDNEIRELLNEGINMEYSYTIEGTSQTFFVTFTESDCF